MNPTMFAWMLSKTAPHGLELVSRPRPAARPGQVVARLRAASLNYRDLLVRDGSLGPTLPIVPVSDAVGEIVEVGAGVTRFRAGDRIAGAFFSGWIDGAIDDARFLTSRGADGRDGVLSEYFTVPESGAVAVPEHLTDAEAATLPCAAVTAWNALYEGRPVQAGETVLALGTGGVALFALQFAKLGGARVIITSSDDAKLERARQLGADDVINYRTNPDWAKLVQSKTQDRGVDLVVDTVGGASLDQVVQSLRYGGRSVLIGVLGGGGAPVATFEILRRNVEVRGVTVGSVAMFTAMNRAIAQHKLRPVVDRTFPFNEAPAAYEHQASGRHFGKIAIVR